MPRRGLRFETEISWFVLASVLDIVMTFLALRFSDQGHTSVTIVENNPVANWVLSHWGIPGMAFFKLVLTAVVVIIAEVIGKVRPLVARALLVGGTLVVSSVVIYTIRLLFLHR
jgi:hypothetical protein